MDVSTTQLPRLLDAKDLAKVFNSRARAYEVFHIASFPTVRIGRRLYVREDRLIEWLSQREGDTEQPCSVGW